MNIPGYQLGREISIGEYCSVYNALEIESSKTVTIKFFQPQLSSNPEFCRHVNTTSQLLLNKSIGNIISIKKAEWDPESCYLITDYFPCAQNQQPLQTEFTIDEVLNFGLQLANSLSKLHALGLVHGGVSTSNLVFPNLSQVTLGIVSFQRTFKQDSSVPALPVSMHEASYIAPEFATGLDARSDFYSLGVVLFELLFRKKPFIAGDIQQLQIKKEQMQYQVPDAFSKRLNPLFDKLLAADPDQRINNASDYIEVIEQCGYKIDNSSSYSEDFSTSTEQDSIHSPSTGKRHNKNIIIFSAAAGLLMIVILSFFMFGNQPIDEKTKSTRIGAIPSSEVDLTTLNNSENITPIAQTENKDKANELYQKSLQHISQNNYGAALMTINNALKEHPGHADALKIKVEIEHEFEIRAYLSRAEKLLQAGKLTRPENDNAFHTYTQLTSLLPDGDTRAREGMEKIAGKYYRLANDLVLKKQFDNARQYITTGLSVIADYEPLKQLDLYIRQEEAKQLALEEQEQQHQQKLKADRINRQKAAAQELQRQQQFIEKNKLAALEREQALKIQQQKELQKNIQLQQKRRKIDDLLSNARNLLRPDQLSHQSLNSSLEIHNELTTLTQQDSRVSNLFEQIINSYSVLARNQKEIPNLAEALTTIDLGLALDRNNTNLRNLKNDIQQLISEAENKQQEVPFIGTF